MPIFSLDSSDDPRLDPFRSLKRSNDNRRAGEFVAEGDKLLDRMLAVGWPITAVLVAETHLERYRRQLPPDALVYVLPAPLVEEVVGFNFHRGVVSAGRRPTNPTLDDIIPEQNQPCTIVVLVDVHDPENVGSILRSSAALGAGAAILTDRCADPFSRRVLRTSMGTVFHLPIMTTANIADILRELTMRNVESVAAVLRDDSLPLEQYLRPSRIAVLLGNEGRGLADGVIAGCHRSVRIPMTDGTDSLNVSVAAGVLLYQLCRRGIGS